MSRNALTFLNNKTNAALIAENYEIDNVIDVFSAAFHYSYGSTSKKYMRCASFHYPLEYSTQHHFSHLIN